MTNYVVEKDEFGKWYVLRLKPKKVVNPRVQRLIKEDKRIKLSFGDIDH